MSRDVFDYLMSLPLLRRFEPFYRKHKEILLYIFFGGCATLVSIGTFVLFHTGLAMNELLANVLSWVITVGFAYLTNRTWVFASQARGKAIWGELFSFYAGRLVTLGLEEGLLLVFATWLSWNATGVKIAGQVVVLVGNYVISKLFIFRKKKGDL